MAQFILDGPSHLILALLLRDRILLSSLLPSSGLGAVLPLALGVSAAAGASSIYPRL